MNINTNTNTSDDLKLTFRTQIRIEEINTMATFNQQGQTVQYQYNAETINFGEVRTTNDFVVQLNNLQAELDKAIAAKAMPKENAMNAENEVKKAIIQAEKPIPDKKSIVEHLTTAKELVSNVGGLAAAVTSAITAIGALL